jgi:hypothetical protein
MIYIRLDNVDRRLGKGEVVSSILPGSTRKAKQYRGLADRLTPLSPALET